MIDAVVDVLRESGVLHDYPSSANKPLAREIINVTFTEAGMEITDTDP